jgi:hemolysin-activating ACP:hemolysin acyltransferase
VNTAASNQPQVPLRAVRMEDPHAALGVAVRLFLDEPNFSRLTFGHWGNTLLGQIQRNHYHLIIQGNEVVGFLGWCLTDEVRAEAWAGGADVPFEFSKAGDCMIINAWVARTAAVNRFVLNEARSIANGKEWIYFKRYYADGRVRPMKLRVNKFAGSHA